MFVTKGAFLMIMLITNNNIGIKFRIQIKTVITTTLKSQSQ